MQPHPHRTPEGNHQERGHVFFNRRRSHALKGSHPAPHFSLSLFRIELSRREPLRPEAVVLSVPIFDEDRR